MAELPFGESLAFAESLVNNLPPSPAFFRKCGF